MVLDLVADHKWRHAVSRGQVLDFVFSYHCGRQVFLEHRLRDEEFRRERSAHPLPVGAHSRYQSESTWRQREMFEHGTAKRELP
jgi:hypothetical protein